MTIDKPERNTAASRGRLAARLVGYTMAAVVGAGVVLALYPDSSSRADDPARNAAPVQLAQSNDPATLTPRAPANLPDLVEQLLPAVVSISTTSAPPPQVRQNRPNPDTPGSPFEDFFRDYFDRLDPNQRRQSAVGSGFVIDPSGFIVTNNHVIAGATEVKVIFQDKTTLTAKILGRDPKADLALLKVESSKPLPAVKWGSSEKTRVGEPVLAIGNPFGLGGTVTSGIISARHRNIGNISGESQTSFVDFLQTDAAINKGNSGGPLFNMKGEVVGINTAIISPRGTNVGIAFAIPSDMAQPIVEQLKKFGKTKRGWLGVQIQTINEDIAQSLGLKKAEGALVAGISPNSPADKGGIQQGDVILKFDNKVVADMNRLPRIVAETEVNKEVDVLVFRKGKEVMLKVKVGELDEADQPKTDPAKSDQMPIKPRTDNVTVLGMTLSPITPDARKQYGIKDKVDGAVVTAIDPNSATAEKLRVGDVILEVAQTKVATTGDAQRLIEKAKKDGARSILLFVQRKDDTQFVALRLEN
ncbi:MAG: DegQ family serine endoprotease [Alphaproteobacteria bacterium]